MLQDRYQRIIQDLRISVTERCNYRCFYCKPEAQLKEKKFRSGILTFEEISRLSRLFVGLGIKKLRLTGGEPLLRRGIETLVSFLSKIPGIADLAMTTNGHLLAEKAQALKDAGLHRLTISLDTLKAERFYQITRSDSLEKVRKGIDAAHRAGFSPLKLNVVIVRGVNDDELLDFAHLARETGHIVRFIEFMPLDEDRRWTRHDVVTAQEMLAKLEEIGPLEEIGRSYSSETATKYRYADGKGEIGIIASVTASFCGQCSRMRLTADGKLRPCLFALQEYDLLERMRRKDSDAQLIAYIREVAMLKEAGHRINEESFIYPQRSMSKIGG